MPILDDYQHFDGRHWETGSVHNHFAYRGVQAPHTGRPYSEALLLGVSGGIVMGYFTFAYEGSDPQCNLLTRNTFDPLDTLLARLGVVQHRFQTAKAEQAVANLVEALEEGVPPIVWADEWTLPYNGRSPDANMWAMQPIVVYGYQPQAGQVAIADRAAVPLGVTPDELHIARARVKKDKFRVLTLDPPLRAKLATAVSAGIGDTIRLFTEKPPKVSPNNFGLAAYRFWARMLTQPRQRLSWAKVFPPGIPMFAGLTFAYTMAFHYGKGLVQDAERALYADFLEEAAVLLEKPALNGVAAQFRAAGQAWQALGAALLPDDVAPLAEARTLLDRRHARFITEGQASLAERQQTDAHLAALRADMKANFPLDAAGVTAFCERLAEAVLAVHAVEETAVADLRAAMA